jgi:2-keto-4-pentenoate hydratase/2-oxohepta-3-ene-1,7-dioic acid hydratase in catechol pathway
VHVPVQGFDEFADPLVCALPALRALTPSILARAQKRSITETEFLSPVRRPGKILAAPNNYVEHTAEMHQLVGDAPARMAGIAEAGFFLKATTSLVGPSQGIVLRFPERRTDHELEFVIVIGALVDGPLTAEEALDHVAGYALGLDITLRGPEERSLRKSIDSYTVLGPWLTTSEEIDDPMKIEMCLSIGDELRQSTPLTDMVMGIGEQISYASRYYTLYPGDLIYTGTPSGVGPIRPGDVILARSAQLGDMRVKVRAAS